MQYYLYFEIIGSSYLCQLPWTIVSDKEKHDCDQVVTQKFVMKRFVCHNDNNIFSIIIVGWLIVLSFTAQMRQFFSLYRAVFQRDGERKEK